MTRTAGTVAALAYVATVVAANYAVKRWGIVSVGFGLYAPAAVYFAGLAFTLRDLTQDALGRRAVTAAIIAGAGLSYLVSNGRLAIASAVAFLVSEGADFAVYTPLRDRGWLRAVAASNLVGLAIDSWIFLTIAFGTTAFLAGQIVGKLWATAAAVGLLAAARAACQRRPATA
jgi:queuosine precursor transporter